MEQHFNVIAGLGELFGQLRSRLDALCVSYEFTNLRERSTAVRHRICELQDFFNLITLPLTLVLYYIHQNVAFRVAKLHLFPTFVHS